MNRINRLALLYGVSMACLDNDFSARIDRSKPERIESQTNKKMIKTGHKKFIFQDGFECFALNQKNADKKHNNWLKNKL